MCGFCLEHNNPEPKLKKGSRKNGDDIAQICLDCYNYKKHLCEGKLSSIGFYYGKCYRVGV